MCEGSIFLLNELGCSFFHVIFFVTLGMGFYSIWATQLCTLCSGKFAFEQTVIWWRCACLVENIDVSKAVPEVFVSRKVFYCRIPMLVDSTLCSYLETHEIPFLSNCSWLCTRPCLSPNGFFSQLCTLLCPNLFPPYITWCVLIFFAFLLIFEIVYCWRQASRRTYTFVFYVCACNIVRNKKKYCPSSNSRIRFILTGHFCLSTCNSFFFQIKVKSLQFIPF